MTKWDYYFFEDLILCCPQHLRLALGMIKRLLASSLTGDRGLAASIPLARESSH